jgi:hypothetical protein
MISRMWARYGWQFALALVLSMLSLLSVSELPALEWLGWFGIVGGAVSILMLRLGGIDMVMPGLVIGFVANVTAFFAIFVLGSRFVRRHNTAPNHGAA